MSHEAKLSDTARTLADDLAESASTIIRNVDVSDIPNLIGEVETFARRNPLTFAALAVGAGLVATRAVTASQKRRSRMDFEVAGGRQDMSSMPATREDIPRTVEDLERVHSDRTTAAPNAPHSGQ